MKTNKELSFALLGPSGSGKTTYLTALMHYFHNSDDWILHPNSAGNHFYGKNIAQLEKGEFPVATFEEKEVSLKIVHRQTSKIYFLKTRDFRGSDFREWLESDLETKEPTSIQKYFQECEAYLFLLAPDGFYPAKSEKYHRELALFEKAMEKASPSTMKNKPMAFAITKVDKYPEILANPKEFMTSHLQRIYKSIQFYHKNSSAFFAISSIGIHEKKEVTQDDSPVSEIPLEFNPYQVEEPVLFLLQKMESQEKIKRRKKRLKYVLFAMIFIFLALSIGILFPENLKKQGSSSWTYFFPKKILLEKENKIKAKNKIDKKNSEKILKKVQQIEKKVAKILQKQDSSLEVQFLLWKEAILSVQKKHSWKEGSSFLEKLSKKIFQNILVHSSESLEKMEEGILFLEKCKRFLRRFFSKQSKTRYRTLKKICQNYLLQIQEKMLQSLPKYNGSNLKKLKKYEESLVFFLRTNPDFSETEKIQKEKKKITYLLKLEHVFQDSKSSSNQKILKLKNSFAFIDSVHYPQIYKKIQKFYYQEKKKKILFLQEKMKRLQKDWASWEQAWQKGKKVDALERVHEQFKKINNIIKTIQKQFSLTFAEKKIIKKIKRSLQEKEDMLLYLEIEKNLKQENFKKCLSKIQEYIQKFSKGSFRKLCFIHKKRISRILKKSKYKVTILRGDLPESQYEAPDGYVLLKINGKVQGKTKVIIDDWYPKWKETFTFYWKYGDSIDFIIFDSDPWSRGGDDLLGHYKSSKTNFLEYWNSKKQQWEPQKNIKITITRSDGRKVFLWISFSY